jgi:hypothetical protein
MGSTSLRAAVRNRTYIAEDEEEADDDWWPLVRVPDVRCSNGRTGQQRDDAVRELPALTIAELCSGDGRAEEREAQDGRPDPGEGTGSESEDVAIPRGGSAELSHGISWHTN